jgi:hypothetical protein
MGFLFASLWKKFTEAFIMQNYKEVCGKDECVWFEIQGDEGKNFLKWAKDLGYIWLNGEEIEPQKGADFFHFSIHSDGKLAYVSMMVWATKHEKFANIKRYMFCEYIQGNFVSPKEYWQTHKVKYQKLK